MKYSKSNPPLVCMQTQSTCYRSTAPMTVKGVLWHCTGANNPALKRYVQPSDNAPDRERWLELLGVNTGRNDWNHIPMQAGLNAWIGKLADGVPTTVQTMPWDYRPWGCGSGGHGTCNDGWVQFEICEDTLTDAEYFDAVYQEGCELTAYICQMYGLDPKGTVSHAGVEVPVILCHRDSAKLGLGSYHGDVYNWFNKHGKTMDDVRRDVAALLAGGDTEPEPEQPVTGDITEGATVKIKPGATYYNSGKVADWILPIEWVVKSLNGSRAVLGASADGAYTINSPIDVKYLSLVSQGGSTDESEESEQPDNDCTVKLSVLRSGSQGNQVKTVQQLLAANGYKPGYADGIMGPATAEAVKKFQRDACLPADGEVGADTWAKLLKG